MMKRALKRAPRKIAVTVDDGDAAESAPSAFLSTVRYFVALEVVFAVGVVTGGLWTAGL